MADIREVLANVGIRLHSYVEGQHYATCPHCSAQRKKKSDRCLSVKIDERGACWFCNHCGWKAGGASHEKSARITPFKWQPAEHLATDADRSRIAVSVLRDTKRADGSIVEHYLRGRNITCPIPPDIRYHPNCPRGSYEKLPAMVAAMRDIRADSVVAIHRTFLKPTGSGKTDYGKAKMMLGPSSGAAIKLASDSDITMGLGICEGIETGLSLISAGWGAIWALGSAGAIERFPVLGGIDALTIFADHDASGVGIAAAAVCEQRWRDAGREVHSIIPKALGADWNDVIVREAA